MKAKKNKSIYGSSTGSLYGGFHDRMWKEQSCT